MKKKFTNRFLILVLSAIFILSGFQAEAQNGYIYIHQKCLDELSSVDFPFTGTGSIGSFSLNDNPTQIASIDLGCSQSGRLWAVSASNVLYYRAVNSTAWVQTSITNALHVAGGPNDTCYVVTTGNSVEIFNGTTATTIATSPSASLGNSGAINISSGWNRSPYVINGNGNLYRYSGTGTTWAQASTGTFQGILDANPVNGNAVVLGGGPNYNVYIVTPAGLLTAIGSPTLNSNTISDIAVDASGNIYTVTGSYVSKYNGGSTWGATDPTSRGSSYMTAGVGNEAWCGGIGGTTSPYGNFFARAVDSLGNTYWIDDERVRTSPTNQNSVLLAVAPGTYTIQQAVPAGWYLQQILIYDSLNHSTANFATASVSITVTAGHTVDVIFQTGLLQTFQMTTRVVQYLIQTISALGSVGSFGPSLTGQTPYHFLNSAVNCNDGYYKVVTSAYDWANFGLGSTNEPNFYDHTTGNGTGQMMAVNASYDKNEFFRRRFEGLVTGARYKFSAWIASFDNVDIQPNVEFEVLDTGTQAIIASSSSGTIAPAGTWVQNSLTFTATAPSFDLVLRNNNIGGNGNDLGLDDINFTLSPVITPVTTIVSTGCNTLGSITVTSPVGSTYEYSLNGGAFQTSTYFPNLPAGIYTITANFIGTTGCSTFQTDTVRAAICGNVFHDNNGLTDSTVNGTGTNAGGVNVVIYDYTIHQAVATAVVQNDGTYQIGGIYTVGGAPGDSLSLYLTTASVTVGQSAIPALTLPTGWIYTGEFLGTGPGSSGTNGILPLGKVTTNLTNANFGINCSAIAGSPQTICQNGSVTTSASSTGTGTWSIRPGNPASTSITSTNSPTTTITGFTVPGIYYFYWSNGCTEDSLEVTVNPVPGTGITGPNVSIAAGSSTTLSATGGSSFLWSPSATLSSSTASSPIATPTATTTYSVTVTNAFSCSSTGTQTVTVVSLPNVSAGDDTFVCVGSGIKLNGSSTTPGATFQWFSTAVNYLNSSTIATPTATPTVAGNYQYILRVTYFSGGIYVSNYDTMYLTAYPVPVITATPSSVSVCNGTPVNISFSSTVSATYTWLASNGTSGTGNISANISNTGTQDSTIIYHVVGTSAGGCKDTMSVTAIVHPVPVLSATGFSKSICGGSNYTGTVTSSVPGAAITWTSTAGLNGSGGNISVPINNSGTTPDTVVFSFTGTYSGCASSVLKDTVIVYPTVTASAGTSQSFCQPVSGTVTLGGNPTATGGSGNYSYAWTPTTDLIGSTLANPTVVSTIATNTEFHLTVTDNVTGCIFTDSTHLTINSKAVVTISGSDDSLCIGNSAVLQATGTPSGGTYQWAPLGSLAPLAGNTPTVTVTPSNVGTQSYQVVYSVSGCHDTAYQAVSAYPAVSAHADSGSNQALTYCFPVSGTVRLGAAATATGGSGGFTYAWSPATNLSSPTASNPIVTISGATTVTYHLTVTDTVTHCTASDSVVLTVNPAPTISTAGLSDTNLCLGSSTVLSATTVSPAGGTYKWSPQLGMTPSNGSSDTVTVSPGASQTYTLVYTSAANCSASASVNVHIYPVVTAHGGGPKNYCPPINSVSLGANPAATGGSGHYTYSWTSSSGSTATLSNPNSPTPTATPTGTTTYYLTVTDSLTGCTSVDSVVVTRNPTPLAQTNASSSICFGGSATLTASGGVTFIWSNAASLSNPNACCPIATPSTTTTYTVTVTDVNGCTASASTTITVGSVLRFTIDSASICQGDTGILTPSLIGPNYRYTWTLEPGISCVSCATPSVYPTSSSIYGLTILDTVNGCSSGTDTAVVTVHANPVASFVTTEACQGQVTQFTDVSTSADPINQWFYNFGDGTLTNDTSRLKNPTYTYQTTTSHIAYETVTTIYGCSSTAHNSVPSYPPVVPYVTPDTCISIGSSITLNATGGNLFAWTPAGTLSNPNISNPVASPLVTTTYKVVVTSANGCTATDSVKITVDTLPNVSAGHDTFVCVGGSVPLRGSSSSPGATYHWTSSVAGILNNPNIAQPIATPTASGTYTFILTATVHDPICNINVSNNDTMILTVDPLPVITATPADTLVACGGSPIIYAFGSNVSGTTYKWRGSNGTSGIGSISTSVNNTTTHDSSVVYTVVGTTPGGCTDTIFVHAVIHPVQTLTATGFSSSLCAGAYFTGTVTSNISGSTITWSTNIGLNGTGGNINVQLNNFGTVADTVIFSFTGSKMGVHLLYYMTRS